MRLIPAAEAKLYRVLAELIPAPSMVLPNLARRQIKMAELARLAGISRRWVIMLLPRLERRHLIRTDGGRGAEKWIWLLPLGVSRIEKSALHLLTQKEKTSPKPSFEKAKAPGIGVSQPKDPCQETEQSLNTKVGEHVEPPVQKPTPARRREVPMPSIPPTGPAPGEPSGRITIVMPPSPTAPADPAIRGTMVIPMSSTPPPAPAKPVSPSSFANKTSAARPPRPGAKIEELLTYVYSQPITPELIGSLKLPGMTGPGLRYALYTLCRQKRCFEDRWSLVGALRATLHDYLT
jgi:hypothetical protein